MLTLFWQFAYLQVLDLLTTVAFLLVGVQEGNPLVRLAIGMGPSPWLGLVIVKVAAMGLGIACLKLGRVRLLGRVNIIFAVVVAWNLVALIAGAASLA